MDKYRKYSRLKSRIWISSLIVALGIGNEIYFNLGFYGERLFSLGTVYYLALVSGIAVVLNFIAIKIADNWFVKNND